MQLHIAGAPGVAVGAREPYVFPPPPELPLIFVKSLVYHIATAILLFLCFQVVCFQNVGKGSCERVTAAKIGIINLHQYFTPSRTADATRTTPSIPRAPR